MIPPTPTSTLFPYTTLFRSHLLVERVAGVELLDVLVHARAERVGRELVHGGVVGRSEEHTSELQSHSDLVCRLLLEKKNSNRSPVCCLPLSPSSVTRRQQCS